jgi:hypothetical protein
MWLALTQNPFRRTESIVSQGFPECNGCVGVVGSNPSAPTNSRNEFSHGVVIFADHFHNHMPLKYDKIYGYQLTIQRQ